MARSTSLSIASVDMNAAQLGETFMSAKHFDYLATVAEHFSGVRAEAA